jgi:hypothetical protein
MNEWLDGMENSGIFERMKQQWIVTGCHYYTLQNTDKSCARVISMQYMNFIPSILNVL